MKLYTIDQAAKTIGVHPKTLRRWEDSGKILPERTLGNQRRYNQTHLNQLQAIKAGAILPPPAVDRVLSLAEAAQKLHVHPVTVKRWTDAGKLPAPYTASRLLAAPKPNFPLLTTPPKSWRSYALISGCLSLFVLVGFWFLNRPTSPASPTIQQAITAPDVQVALPSVANFLNGRITIGSDTGNLSYLDQKGNFYLKNSALIEGGLHTSSLQLIPSAQPDDQLGRQYVDQKTGNLMYFDGLDWIALNKNASSAAANAFPTVYDQNDLDFTLGDLTASASATSLRLTLAGPQSQFKILGGASQEILTINDDSIYPVLISQPTKITGSLYAPKLLDTDNNAYFLDPASTDLSLNLAGSATISGTLTLDLSLKTPKAHVTNELTIDNLKVFDNTIQANSDDGLKLFDNEGKGITIADGGTVTINGTAVPDYVFEPDYPLLSPVDLQAYILKYHHLPGVPNADEVKTNGLNLSTMLMALLEKIEENTLYILDLNHRLGLVEEKLLTPTVATEVLATQALSPLTATPIDASAITGLKETIIALFPSPTPTPVPAPVLEASQSAALAQLTAPVATNSGYLSLDSIDAKIGFFSDYLAVLGQTTLTDLKVTNDLQVNSILAGLITLDEITGQVTIKGNLNITGSVTVAELKPPLEETLNINIASSSGILIYSDINDPVANISSQSAAFSRLDLSNSGTATISAGTNNALVSAPKLTGESQIIITFSSDYKPATKYWVTKDNAKKEFTVFVNYPVNSDSTLSWLIIN